MGLPGHRRTSSHKRRRAAHFAIQTKSLSRCKHCGQAMLPHRVCLNCGYYGDKQVIKIKSKVKSQKSKSTEEKSKG